MRLIDADALWELARNNKNRSVNCNEIAWFPTIEAELVRHGEWIDGQKSFGAKRGLYIVCSRCHHCIVLDKHQETPMTHWQYCPSCGAKMDGGNNDAAD